MLKKSVGQKDKDMFILGQAYHMDLVFVSGSDYLKDISVSIDCPKLTVKQSRDRYIGFLAIIDVATRQLWTHMIKNKNPPTQYIDTLLKQHETRQTDPSKGIITTSRKGYLAHSKAFEAMVKKLPYKIQTTKPNYFTNTFLPILF